MAGTRRRSSSRSAAPTAATGHAEAAAPLFAALGDATRLGIVSQLATRGPLPIVQLTDGTGLTRQAITKHLRALERGGLVSSNRVGRERIWELRRQRLTEARAHLDAISAQWDHAIDRLRAFVED